MGDRELPVANRTVQKRWLRYTASLHHDAKAASRTSIPQSPPPTYAFLSSRSKRAQSFTDRAATIERENLLLLEKMRTIMTERQMDAREPFLKDSLNRGARKQEMVRIMGENEALLRRIQNRRPVYQVDVFEAQHAQKEALLARVGRFPYVSESVPDMTPPPVPNSKLKYYGYSGRQAALMSKRTLAGSSTTTTAPGTLPRIAGAQGSPSATAGSQSARKAVAYVPSAPAPKSPASSRTRGGKGQRGGATAKPPARVLVFSGEVDVDGSSARVSIYERAAGGLEVVGVDASASAAVEEQAGSTAPFYAFASIATAFAAKDETEEEQKVADDDNDASSQPKSIPRAFFLAPVRARDIATALLPRLAWTTASDEEAPRQLRLAGLEADASLNGSSTAARGALRYTRVRIAARGLPQEKTTPNPPVAVLYAMNEETGQYQQIAHASLKAAAPPATASAPREFVCSVVLPHYDLVDGPLRMGIFEVDARRAVVPTSCVGEVKWSILGMVATPATELKLRMMKNGKPLPRTAATGTTRTIEPTVHITHEPAKQEDTEAEDEEATKEKEEEETKEAEDDSAQEPDAEPSIVEAAKAAVKAAVSAAAEDDYEDDAEEEDDEDDVAPKKAKPLFQVGRNLDGVDVLVSAVDSDAVPVAQRPASAANASGVELAAVLFHLYYRPTSRVFDHAVAKSAIPSLLASLPNAADAVTGSLTEQAEALLTLFSATGGADGAEVAVFFGGAPLVAWKDLKLQPTAPIAARPASSKRASARASRDTPVLSAKASPKASPKPSPKVSPKPSPRTSARSSKRSSATSATTPRQASSRASQEKKPIVDEASSVAQKVEAFEKAAEQEAESLIEKKPAPQEEEETETAEVPPTTTTAAADEPAAEVAPEPVAEPEPAVDLDADLAVDALDDIHDPKEDEKPVEPVEAGSEFPPEEEATEPAVPTGTTSGDIVETEQPKDDLDAVAPTDADEKDDETLPAVADAEPVSPPAEEVAPVEEAEVVPEPEPAAEVVAEPVESASVADEFPADEPVEKSRPASASSKKPVEAAIDSLSDELDADVLESSDAAEKATEEAAAEATPEETSVEVPAAEETAVPEEAPVEVPAVEEAAAPEEDDTAATAAAEEEAAAAAEKAAAEAAEEEAKKAAQEAAQAQADAEAESKAAEERAAAEEAAAKAQAEKEAAEAKEAEERAAAEAAAEAEKKAEEEAAAAAAAAVAADEEAAAKKAEEEAAAAAAAAAIAAEQAEADAKAAEAKAAETEAAVEAAPDAAAAPASSPEPAAAAPSTPSPITLTMSVSCSGLPEPKSGVSLCPMVAMYAEGADGQYSFISQTERLVDTSSPAFATRIPFETDAASSQAALMFSVYHVVEGVPLSEEDMIGQALSTQGELAAAIERGEPLELALQANGTLVPNALVRITDITRSEGHASAAAAATVGATQDAYEVFVSCRNLRRGAEGDATVSPMVALYAADAAGEFAYIAQTERIESQSSPTFTTGIRVSSSSSSDQQLMFSLYDVKSGAEISAEDQIGAATTTMHAIIAATQEQPITLTIAKDDAVLDGAEITAYAKKVQ